MGALPRLSSQTGAFRANRRRTRADESAFAGIVGAVGSAGPQGALHSDPDDAPVEVGGRARGGGSAAGSSQAAIRIVAPPDSFIGAEPSDEDADPRIDGEPLDAADSVTQTGGGPAPLAPSGRSADDHLREGAAHELVGPPSHPDETTLGEPERPSRGAHPPGRGDAALLGGDATFKPSVRGELSLSVGRPSVRGAIMQPGGPLSGALTPGRPAVSPPKHPSIGTGPLATPASVGGRDVELLLRGSGGMRSGGGGGGRNEAHARYKAARDGAQLAGDTSAASAKVAELEKQLADVSAKAAAYESMARAEDLKGNDKAAMEYRDSASAALAALGDIEAALAESRDAQWKADLAADRAADALQKERDALGEQGARRADEAADRADRQIQREIDYAIKHAMSRAKRLDVKERRKGEYERRHDRGGEGLRRRTRADRMRNDAEDRAWRNADRDYAKVFESTVQALAASGKSRAEVAAFRRQAAKSSAVQGRSDAEDSADSLKELTPAPDHPPPRDGGLPATYTAKQHSERASMHATAANDPTRTPGQRAASAAASRAASGVVVAQAKKAALYARSAARTLSRSMTQLGKQGNPSQRRQARAAVSKAEKSARAAVKSAEKAARIAKYGTATQAAAAAEAARVAADKAAADAKTAADAVDAAIASAETDATKSPPDNPKGGGGGELPKDPKIDGSTPPKDCSGPCPCEIGDCRPGTFCRSCEWKRENVSTGGKGKHVPDYSVDGIDTDRKPPPPPPPVQPGGGGREIYAQDGGAPPPPHPGAGTEEARPRVAPASPPAPEPCIDRLVVEIAAANAELARCRELAEVALYLIDQASKVADAWAKENGRRSPDLPSALLRMNWGAAGDMLGAKQHEWTGDAAKAVSRLPALLVAARESAGEMACCATRLVEEWGKGGRGSFIARIRECPGAASRLVGINFEHFVKGMDSHLATEMCEGWEIRRSRSIEIAAGSAAGGGAGAAPAARDSADQSREKAKELGEKIKQAFPGPLGELLRDVFVEVFAEVLLVIMYGDANERVGIMGTVAQILLGLTPLGLLDDIRSVVHAAQALSATNPASMVQFGTAVLGFLPGLGDAAKGRRLASEAATRTAKDAAGAGVRSAGDVKKIAARLKELKNEAAAARRNAASEVERLRGPRAGATSDVKAKTPGQGPAQGGAGGGGGAPPVRADSGGGKAPEGSGVPADGSGGRKPPKRPESPPGGEDLPDGHGDGDGKSPDRGAGPGKGSAYDEPGSAGRYAENVESWLDQQRGIPERGTGEWADYQRKVCGDMKYELPAPPGEKIVCDGVRPSSGTILESKFVGDPASSPYRLNPNMPEAVADKINAKTVDEFRRYSQVLKRGSTPLRELEVITNDPGAVPFFESMMRRFEIPGRVVVR